MQFVTRISQAETWKLEMAVVQQTGSRQTLVFYQNFSFLLSIRGRPLAHLVARWAAE